MKILHIAPNAPYNRGWGYQENLLPKYHKKLGHDVTVVVQTRTHQDGAIVDTPPEEWCGNARNAGLMPDFESALREPESGAVMGLVQTMGNFGLCLSMDPEEEGISCDPGVPRSVPVARLLSRMIGCDVRKTSRGIAKWFASSCGKPAFTCGFGCDPVTLYTSVKEALFSSPLLI